MSEIKVGQIWINQQNYLFVVVQTNDSCINTFVMGKKWLVTRSVYRYYADDKVKRGKWRKIAEYPTWQEAVNSKEFNGECL